MVENAHDILRLAVADHKPTHIFGLFSGGHDSLVACHLLSQFDNYKFNVRQPWSVVHINTGIGVEETREYVREFASRLEVPLIEKYAPQAKDE